MKNTHYYILVLLACIGCFSCENFRDNNGDLGGMWQLTQWRTRSSSGQIDSLVANNDRDDVTLENKRKLFYCIHRDVFQVKDASTYFGTSYYCTFSHTGQELTLGNLIGFDGKCYVDGEDANRTYEQFADFGIPADGHFHIDNLTDEQLTMSFTDNILLFRKY